MSIDSRISAQSKQTSVEEALWHPAIRELQLKQLVEFSTVDADG